MIPLIYSPALSQSLGAAVHLKLENLQPAHSFKSRGLFLFASRAREQHGPAVHLIIASGGNAALALASAAQTLAVTCTVYLPEGAAQSTIDILRRSNADVVVAGRFYAEALHAAQLRTATDPHAVLAPAYDHETLWEGHASIVTEIAAQLPAKPDAIFCSVGGGGLLGGLIHGCHQVSWDDGAHSPSHPTHSQQPPPVPIVALETIGSDCFFHSISLNTHTSHPLPPNVVPVHVPEHTLTLAHFTSFSSKASGSLGASQPSARVVKSALSRPGKVICASVPDELSMHALAMFAGTPFHSIYTWHSNSCSTDDHKLLVELACATTLTPAYSPALFDRLVPPKPNGATRTVVFIVCGGFKISLDDAAEYKRLAEQDRARGGVWNVLMDDGSTFAVDK
ncbi:hypothetical protein C0992_008590 [Termitomyces sp. T32_za158]|nr:hypothetical protein C0992_008590 [Termitomyces sp. T32_za158]